MDNSPFVSILLPVYNGEKTLGRTLDSLLVQTHQDFEILIGIDGTKDNSKAIAESYNDPRIKIIEHPENLGLANNLNTLVRQINPNIQYMAMAEQDDVYEPQRLEWQLQIMEQHPEVGLVSGICKFVSKNNEILFPGILVHGKQYPQGEELFKFLYINQLKVVNTCMMVRTKVHKENRLKFRNTYGNFNVDWDYILRFSLVSKVYGIPKLLVTMNRDQTNTSVTRDKTQQHQASRLLLKNIKMEFSNIIGDKEYRQALKQHRKIELGHHEPVYIIFKSLYFSFYYLDAYFIKYLLKRINLFRLNNV